jgi:transposase
VFQVHGVDAAGAIVFRRQLQRAEIVTFFAKLPPCLVGLEACATAHYRGRQIAALGHRVRLMPPTRVSLMSDGAARTTKPARRPVARR